MKRRKRNPSISTGAAAVTMGIVGAAIGAASSAIAGRREAVARVTIGALTGGALGAGLGAVLARSESRMRNPSKNPIAVSSALLAGTAVAIVPPIVALEIAGRHRAAPSARGSLGRNRFDVRFDRDRWCWTAGTDGGFERTRRAAVVAAVVSLTPLCGANDHVDVELVRPSQSLSVAPQICGGWAWSSGKHSGTSSTRRGALVEGLAVLREFKDPS